MKVCRKCLKNIGTEKNCNFCEDVAAAVVVVVVSDVLLLFAWIVLYGCMFSWHYHLADSLFTTTTTTTITTFTYTVIYY